MYVRQSMNINAFGLVISLEEWFPCFVNVREPKERQSIVLFIHTFIEDKRANVAHQPAATITTAATTNECASNEIDTRH